MNQRLPLVIISISILIFSAFTVMSLTGKVDTTRKPGAQLPGCFCHGIDSTSSSVRAWITGPDSLNPGQTALFRIHTSKVQLIEAGFNVAAYFGTLEVNDSIQTRKELAGSPKSFEITHTNPLLSFGRDTVSWTFTYTAPNRPGTANTVCADSSLDPNGDFWNYAPNFIVRVRGISSIAATVKPATGFELAQNYPNPFNPSTVISYQLLVFSDVKLEVFDIVGRKMATLVNERRAAGSYRATFNAANLSSGIYFYRLQAGNFTLTKKMLLVK
jgi:Secretion system C-terminal sorting domain